MNSTIYIATTLVAFLVGQWLVTRKHWSGFLVWCLANIYSMVTCIRTDMPQTSLLFAAYLIVNFASLRSWFANSRTTALVGLKEAPTGTIHEGPGPLQLVPAVSGAGNGAGSRTH